MRASRKQVPIIVNLIVVIFSTISLAEATANYVRFYDALTNLGLQVTNINFITEHESVNATIDLQISNPTSYDRLRLLHISGTAHYEGEPHIVIISPGKTIAGGTPFQAVETRWWALASGRIGSINRPILPYSTINLSMNINAIGESAKRFIDYFDKQGGHQEDIRWQIELRVYLDTPIFLDTINLEYQFSL